MSFLFRIAGDPVKYRWTYRLEPEVSEHDIEGIAQLDRFRGRVPVITFERYER
jgi:hypothetical protein